MRTAAKTELMGAKASGNQCCLLHEDSEGCSYKSARTDKSPTPYYFRCSGMGVVRGVGGDSLSSSAGQPGSKKEARGLGTLSPTGTSSGALSQRLPLPALLIKLRCLGRPVHPTGVTLRRLKVLQKAFLYLPKTGANPSQSAGQQNERSCPGWRFQRTWISGCILNMN